MRSSTGRWVSGEDFFDRERELEVLKTRVRERNHVLLTGQRRMGKTSILRELGSRLESEGWIFRNSGPHQSSVPPALGAMEQGGERCVHRAACAEPPIAHCGRGG